MRSLLRGSDRPRFLQLKVRGARILTSPLMARILVRRRTRLSVGGLQLETNSPSISDSARAEILLGLYEGAEARLLQKHPPPRGTIVDLGSSIGFLASTAARKAPPGTRVVCIEANGDLIPLLRRTLALNASHCSVEVIHGAIDYSADDSQVVHFRSGGNHTSSKIVRSDADAFSAPRVRIRDHLAPAEPFSLLMDIEGAESGVLIHERDLLASCVQIVAEFHDTESPDGHLSIEDLITLAWVAGFTIVERYGPVVVLKRRGS